MKRTEWMAVAAMAAAMSVAEAAPVAVRIDAGKKAAAPVSRMVFGGFMEPATTGVWAEMLADRKFYYEINSKPEPAQPAGGFGRRGPRRRWLPVGGDESVSMDRKGAWVGEWSPRVKLEAGAEHGISQTGLAVRKGCAYTGRVVLAGEAGAKVEVRLVWGPGEGQRQVVQAGPLTAAFTKFPLKFTAGADATDARLEIVGKGSGSFRIGAVSLMPADNVSGFKAGMLKLLKEQGMGILRWPGGNFVSAYDWRDGLGDADKRPPRKELAWNGMEPNDMGLDDFLRLCGLLGAEPYIAVNTGFGDAHSAAEEVEYVNGPAASRMGRLRAANGHAAPYGVKIWGIGNEMYGPWQWGHMAITQYPEKHNQFVKAMRAVDPKIEVIASSATPEELSWTYVENRQLGTFPERQTVSDRVPYAFGSQYDWTGALLKESADQIDYLGEHFYGYPNLVIDVEKQAFVEATDPLEDRVRRMSNKVQCKFEAWDEYLKRMPELKGKRIRFAFDEWAPRNRPVRQGGAAPAAINPMLNPLTNALVYHEFFRHPEMVGLAVATGGMMLVAQDTYGEPTGFRMEGLVAKLLHEHFAGRLPVEVSGDSPQKAIRGAVGVDTSERPSGSPTYPLDVVAALSADGKRLSVSIVNPTETEQECDWTLGGMTAAGGAKYWQLVPPEGAAAAVPAGPGRGFFGPPAKMSQGEWTAVPARVKLPAASMTVVEIALR